MFELLDESYTDRAHFEKSAANKVKVQTAFCTRRKIASTFSKATCKTQVALQSTAAAGFSVISGLSRCQADYMQESKPLDSFPFINGVINASEGIKWFNYSSDPATFSLSTALHLGKMYLKRNGCVNVNVYTLPAVCTVRLPLYMLCVHTVYVQADVLWRLSVCILVVNKIEQMQDRQTQTLTGWGQQAWMWAPCWRSGVYKFA